MERLAIGDVLVDSVCLCRKSSKADGGLPDAACLRARGGTKGEKCVRCAALRGQGQSPCAVDIPDDGDATYPLRHVRGCDRKILGARVRPRLASHLTIKLRINTYQVVRSSCRKAKWFVRATRRRVFAMTRGGISLGVEDAQQAGCSGSLGGSATRVAFIAKSGMARSSFGSRWEGAAAFHQPPSRIFKVRPDHPLQSPRFA